jgi:hypothetical protein
VKRMETDTVRKRRNVRRLKESKKQREKGQ